MNVELRGGLKDAAVMFYFLLLQGCREEGKSPSAVRDAGQPGRRGQGYDEKGQKGQILTSVLGPEDHCRSI